MLTHSFRVHGIELVEALLVDRQLAMKGFKGPSWTADIREILAMYQLPSAHDIFDSTPRRLSWKNRVYRAIDRYWEDTIRRTGNLYSSLAYLDFNTYKIGVTHPALIGVQSTEWDIQRMATKLRLLTGTYHFQTNRKSFNQYAVDSKCALCLSDTDDVEHMLGNCGSTEHIRREHINKLHTILGSILTPREIASKFTSLLLNPTLVVHEYDNVDIAMLETSSRATIYIFHKFRQCMLQE
jgi:hypothetical protein